MPSLFTLAVLSARYNYPTHVAASIIFRILTRL
jgi:hypothetical protein